MATTKPTRFTEIRVSSNADILGDLEVSGTINASAGVLETEAGTGITTGTGTVYQSSVSRVGGIIKTSILLDLTGLTSAATENDIIGVNDAANCHLGQITADRNGTIFGGRVTCLETPAGGEVDIDLYSAVESTGTENALITGLDETALLAAAADWAANDVKTLSAVPAADEYLYLAVGTGSTPTAGDYTAGKFLIELEGYAA
jgi:hypothetical protein